MPQSAAARRPQHRRPSRLVDTTLVKALLAERGWTALDLAREMGMDRTSVRQTLLGRYRVSWGFYEALLAVFPRHRPDQLFIRAAEFIVDDDAELVDNDSAAGDPDGQGSAA